MEKIWRLYSNTGDNKSKNVNEAIMRNDCRYVIDYFEAGGDINILDNKNETLLHKASRNEFYEMVDLLIKLGLDVNAVNKYGDSPLHIAVQFKNEEIVQKLIMEGASINKLNNKKMAPLHIAASVGDETIIGILLDNGARINISDENGMHPIHYAVKSGKSNVIRTILNCGASLTEVDDRKNSVLHHAVLSGNDELVTHLLRYLNISDCKNIYGETPLHLAAKYCTVKAIQALLNAGYNPEIKNNSGQTPYDVAMLDNKEENAQFLSKYLLSKDYKEHFLRFKLHHAVVMNNYQYIYEKVSSTNVNNFDYFGRSLLYYAVILGYNKIATLLYMKGARLNNIDEYNQSALLLSVYSENNQLVEYFLSKKADPNEIFYNRSYLYRAVLKNNFEMTKLLVKYGADVNYVDGRHRTIYSYAMEYADDDIIELLLDSKASMV